MDTEAQKGIRTFGSPAMEVPFEVKFKGEVCRDRIDRKGGDVFGEYCSVMCAELQSSVLPILIKLPTESSKHAAFIIRSSLLTAHRCLHTPPPGTNACVTPAAATRITRQHRDMPAATCAITARKPAARADAGPAALQVRALDLLCLGDCCAKRLFTRVAGTAWSWWMRRTSELCPLKFSLGC